jgi:hypothetical protein
MELERIPWALLPEQPPVARSPEIPNLNRIIREEEQSAADAQVERHIETFSVFAFFGGTFLFLVFPASLLLAVLVTFLFGLRQGAAKSRAAELRLLSISFASVLFLFWTALSCVRGYFLFQNDPRYAHKLWGDTMKLLAATSPPLPSGFVNAAEQWLAGIIQDESFEDFQPQTTEKDPTIPWSLVLALGGLIVGAGKYVDDYLISKEIKSRVRDFLIVASLV